jgi:hypothetical protein
MTLFVSNHEEQVDYKLGKLHCKHSLYLEWYPNCKWNKGR